MLTYNIFVGSKLLAARAPHQEPVEVHDLGQMSDVCQHCSTLHWKAEQLSASKKVNVLFGTCCNSGRVRLSPLDSTSLQRCCRVPPPRATQRTRVLFTYPASRWFPIHAALETGPTALLLTSISSSDLLDLQMRKQSLHVISTRTDSLLILPMFVPLISRFVRFPQSLPSLADCSYHSSPV